jgi:hypothetical protein
MKASEMICLLAKQIEMNRDREVVLCVPNPDCELGDEDDIIVKPLSVAWDMGNQRIEIYGE